MTFTILLIVFTSCEKERNSDVFDTPDVVTTAVTTYDKSNFDDDYLLITPLGSKMTYLINKQGFPVKKWESEHQAHMGYLDNTGGLYRNLTSIGTGNLIGEAGGGIEYFDATGAKIWEWHDDSLRYLIHHDLIVLPNGNVIVSAYERRSSTESQQAGRDIASFSSNEVVADVLLEIERGPNNTANIVWKWDVWNHLSQDYASFQNNFMSVSGNPQRIDINFNHGDNNLCHINSLDYIPEHDQIVMSSRSFDELWIIDHSTTTQQAQGSTGGRQNKGGDLLYRWGNPASYKTGMINDRLLFKQHDVTYIGNLANNGGNFLIFNNQIASDQSAAVEVSIPVAPNGRYNLMPNVINQPTNYNWQFQSNQIYSGRRSGAQRLINGNTLITSFSGRTITEVASNGTIVWRYEVDLESEFLTGSSAFKVRAYNENDTRLNNYSLMPLDPSEY